ncbi:MAG: amino acid adenylation domain-containing protein, partial [Desulfamplus sp.]|nr:amino acid adenylation domain-containing protein [Desulfamplus sp.]
LPIRSRIDWNQTFDQYLKEFRSVLLNGYQNQDYPFAELMDKISLQRDGQRPPLVSVLFNLDRPGDPPEMDGLAIQWLSQPIYYTAFDITLNLTMVDSSIVLECDFNLDRFEQSSIERYTNHFITLLNSISQNPDASVASLGLLDADEKKKILIDWNDTFADYPSDKCMHRLFEEQAEKNPDAVAIRICDFMNSINSAALDNGGHNGDMATQTGSSITSGDMAGQKHTDGKVTCGDFAGDADSKMMSYRKLNEMANRIAHGLIELGTKTEDVIGIYMHHSVELIAGFLGILKAGAAYLPLDPSYPPKRLAFMLEDAGAKILLTHTPLLASLPETSGIKTVVINDDATVFKEKSTDNPQVAVTPQNLAYLIYTSGSTGLPKGTMIIHKGFVNYLTWAVKYYRVAEGEGSPLHSSIGFDATITSIFTPLICGRCLWLFASDNMGNNIENKGQELENIHSALMSGINWSLMKFTPAHLELINAMIAADKLSGLTRCLVFGGEALLGRQVEPWRKNAPTTRLINEYGPTETVVGCCIYEVEETNPDPGSLPIGKPIDNTRLYILDANLQPVPVGVTGELFIGGDGVARGYLGREDLNRERFIDVSSTGLADTGVPQERLYRTGDLVRYEPDGTILYFGRMDNQIKIRGYRVELGEVENALIRQPGVREAVVVAHRRSDQDIRLIAWVVAESENQLSASKKTDNKFLKNKIHSKNSINESRLKQSLGVQLPAHMVPSNIVILDALPLTVNGKVDRAALPLPENLRSGTKSEFVNPRSQAEERIADIWKAILVVDKVGMEDNFFEIGGH